MPTTEKMEKLKRDLAAMAEMVERMVDSAVMSLVDRNADLAREIDRYDAEVDEMEISVDKQCIHLLQIEHPQSENFRFVIAAMKINNDLERMGDLSALICQRVLQLVRKRSIMKNKLDYSAMMEATCRMVRDSIQSLLDKDARLAIDVWNRDEFVNEELQKIVSYILKEMKKDPNRVERGHWLIGATHALERIADQATNIAEEVVYMLEGRIIKHSRPEDDHTASKRMSAASN